MEQKITKKELLNLVTVLDISASERKTLSEFIEKNEDNELSAVLLAPYFEKSMENTERNPAKLEEDNKKKMADFDVEKKKNEKDFEKEFDKYYTEKYDKYFGEMEKMETLEKEIDFQASDIIEKTVKKIREVSAKYQGAMEKNKVEEIRKKLNLKTP